MKIKKIIVYIALFLSSLLAKATTYNVTPSSNLQTVINGTSIGDTVAFGAGTYTISAAITLKCGVTYTGPTVTQASNGLVTPTAILNGSGLSYQSSVSIFYLNSSSAGNPCTANTLIQYLDFDHASGIQIQTPFTNLTIQYNSFTNIPGYYTGSPSNASGVRSTALFFVAATNATQSQTLSNTLVTHNQIGDANSCTSPSNIMTYLESPDQAGGACQGQDFFTSINGYTFTHNLVWHVSEGTHVDCPNYAPSQQYVCEPPGGAQIQNMTVEYNDFYQMHRIAWEQQVQQSGNLNFQYNSYHDWIDPYFGSMGNSMACCYNGTISQPNLTVTNNTVIFNTSTNTGDFLSYGFEAAGKLATYDHNLLQETNVSSGKTNAPGITWGCGPNASNSYNTIQGGWGGYIVGEGISACGTDTQPAQIVGNVTGTTLVVQTSYAPTISPSAGPQSYPLTVTLTDPGYSGTSAVPLGNTSIWYTTDGSTPVPGSGTAKRLDSGGTFVLAAAATVKAVGMWGADVQPTSYATGYGWNPSATVSNTYTSGGTTPTLTSCGIIQASNINTIYNGGTIPFQLKGFYSDGSSGTLPDTYGNNPNFGITNGTGTGTVTTPGGVYTATSNSGTVSVTAFTTGTTPIGCSSWTVTNTAAILQSISLATTGGVTTLTVGATNQLIATGYYSDGTTPNVNSLVNTWTTSNGSYATITGSGLVTGVSAGTPTFTATIGSITSSPVLPITISGSTVLQSIVISNNLTVNTMYLKWTLNWQAQCYYSDGTNYNCTTADTHGNTAAWLSSNTASATFSSNILTEILAGGGNVSASAAGVTSNIVNMTYLGIQPLTFTMTGAIITIKGGNISVSYH